MRILLKADADHAEGGWTDAAIGEALSLQKNRPQQGRKIFVEEGWERMLTRKQREMPPTPLLCDGEKEARLIQLACAQPPEGRACWTLALLAEKGVALQIVGAASDSTVYRTLQKNALKPHLKKQGVLPPENTAAFVAAMEDVLEVSTRPHDPANPLVCRDEARKQLTKATRIPRAMKPGEPERCDDEYARNGTANRFMLFAPREGWRNVEVPDRRTAVDYAQILKALADTPFPKAEKILLVQAHLNTHAQSSLSEAFPPEEARRICERFAWHSTPKHGSWLHRAASALAPLANQCLARRIPDKATLAKEVSAWQEDRNKNPTKADWQFTTEKARVKLKRLYPVIEKK